MNQKNLKLKARQRLRDVDREYIDELKETYLSATK
jgi:hypothetical protein